MVTSESSLLINPAILARSTFQVDRDGWRHDGDCTLTHSPTEGNPGGCLKAVAAASGDVYNYLAPEKFLGRKESAVRIEYDIKWVASESLPILLADRELELGGGGTVLLYNPGPPLRNGWFHCVVPLHPIGGVWTNQKANRPATHDDFRVVLASLEKLAIRGEFARGGPEIGYLDNVVMYRKYVLGATGSDEIVKAAARRVLEGQEW